MENAEKQQKTEERRTLQAKPISSSSFNFLDCRKETLLQGKMINVIQCTKDPNEVLTISELTPFLQFQDELQSELTSMNGLQSIGFEFEFASFKKSGEEYTKEEIIPSHIPMAKSNTLINYFKLPWSLESDSMNTLELVTPPFIFPHVPKGFEKSKEMQAIMNNELHSIPSEQPTFPKVVKRLSTLGMGKNWFYSTEYENYTVIPNQKSGGKVYEQVNISMFPEEIAQYLKVCFDSYTNKEMAKGDTPVYLALSVKDILKSHLSVPTPEVENAINVFARYASNAVSIPAMLDRQQTGIRKDPMPTTIKETFGIWIKADALNLLTKIFSNVDELNYFITTLTNSKDEILGLFKEQSSLMLKNVTDSKQKEADSLKSTLTVRAGQLMTNKRKDNPTIKINRELLQNIKSQLSETDNQYIEDKWNSKLANMSKYIDVMFQEVIAFIERTLNMKNHIETTPKETTEDFLKEKYGTGEGVRKGTYLPSIPTKDGPMYVTELR